MITKEILIETIRNARREKRPGYLNVVRQCFHDLAKLDDPYGEHEFHGTEEKGRHCARCSGRVAFDKMDDESEP